MVQFFLFNANIKRTPFIVMVVLFEIIGRVLPADMEPDDFSVLTLALALPLIYLAVCIFKARLNDAGLSGWWALPAWIVEISLVELAWEIAGENGDFFALVLGYTFTIIIACMPTANPSTNKYYIPKGE